MPHNTNKREQAQEGLVDETLPAQKKSRSTSRNKVKFADTAQAVLFDERLQPKSILKTRSAPFPTAPESTDPDAARSPSPEPTDQLEGEDFDREEADASKKLAADASAAMKKAEMQRLKHDLAATQQELAFVKNNLAVVRDGEKDLKQALRQARSESARSLTDANFADKRTKTAHAEVREAMLVNGKLEDKYRTLEDQLKNSHGQVEELQRELAVVKEENSNFKKMLGTKTANKTADLGGE